MAERPRYRDEAGEPCLDIRIANLEQLFDNRDPAPFRERDLDPDLVEYMTAAADDLHAHATFRIIVWLAASRPAGDVAPAIRAHFAYELERLERQRRRQRRIGQLALLIGVTGMFGLISLAQLLIAYPLLREGLVIFSWVLLWRPIEILIYEWVPVHQQRRLYRRLRDAPIELRVGAGPDEHLAIPAAPSG